MGLLNEILEDIKPTKKEEQDIEIKLKDLIRDIKIKNAKVILGGSGAKGTWLRRSYDADIFVLFDYQRYKDKSDKLSAILKQQLKKRFRIKQLHGSRDYFQVNKGGFTFEIVPILGIKKASDAKNITDVSPLHALWVKKNSNTRLRDDIRLMKQFCKANSIYGAESYIQGYSGYVLEILIIYYGGFLKLLRAAAKWKDKVVIDIEKHYKNKQQIFFDLNKSKQLSPMIIIDPVDKSRNAAAALSYDKFERLIGLSREFLHRPSRGFFEIKETTADEIILAKKENKLILFRADVLSGKQDIVGSKLVKVFNHIREKLLNEEFKIIDHGWQWNHGKKALLWFYINSKELSKEAIIPGPPLFMKRHVKKFKAKYNSTFIQKKRIFAKIKRKYTMPEKLVKEILNSEYVIERVKKIEWLKK